MKTRNSARDFVWEAVNVFEQQQYLTLTDCEGELIINLTFYAPCTVLQCVYE